MKYFYIHSELCFSVDENIAAHGNELVGFTALETTISLLYERIGEAIDLVREDVAAYNIYLEKNLAYQKRTGRIVRKMFWDICGADAEWLDEKLGTNHVEAIKTIVDKQKSFDQPLLPNIPALLSKFISR